LKETASSVLQRLQIENGVTVIKPNPIQSMDGSNPCPTLVQATSRKAVAKPS